MDTNTCDVNYLDSDALLPPRKRLLAGLKRQSSDVNLPAPSTSSVTDNDYNNRLNNLLRSQLSNPNLSNEEIAEDSRIAALKAANVAEAARAKAEEKAAKAAKAVAAAKRALDLVATLSEDTAIEGKCPKKNKTKKHVPVQALYSKKKGYTNGKTDEEVARNLHRAINSSPRITKNSGSDLKNYKHKKLKSSTFINNGVMVAEKVRPSSNNNGIVREVNSEGPVKGVDMIMVDLNESKSDKGDQVSSVNVKGRGPNKTHELKFGNGELEPLLSKEKFTESMDSVDNKKGGKMKQKSLPLRICNYRDQTSPKDCLKPLERTNIWKCQSFKADGSVEQNKVMQS